MSGSTSIYMRFSHTIKSGNVNNRGRELDTGDTAAMLLDDFNGNGLSDPITINQLGTIQFFKNMGESGLVAVGSPVQAQGSGPLKALDVLQNNRRILIQIAMANLIRYVLRLPSSG